MPEIRAPDKTIQPANDIRSDGAAMNTRALTGVRRLVAVMARLRDPHHGCAWDRAQNFASIAPYTIEEAYEVADAIAQGDLPALCDELGDLLLQVVFHARMAQEMGAFDLADVADAIVAKMERRHPHIFGPQGGGSAARTAGEVAHAWEAIKATETPRASALDGVAHALPALLRADKLGRRAARVGFDWPDAAGARAKLIEELDELAAAATPAEREEEMGDLLLAAASLARHMGIDPETALRLGNAKFERRFRAMEAAAGDAFAALPADAKEALWAQAKTDEHDRGDSFHISAEGHASGIARVAQ